MENGLKKLLGSKRAMVALLGVVSLAVLALLGLASWSEAIDAGMALVPILMALYGLEDFA